jgi:hypothetical protein
MKAKKKSKCQHIDEDGPCIFDASKGSNYCALHRPEPSGLSTPEEIETLGRELQSAWKKLGPEFRNFDLELPSGSEREPLA